VVAHWTSEHEKAGGEIVKIDFDVAYFLQTLPGKTPKIFGFVAGDEIATLKQHGLLPDMPPPASQTLEPRPEGA
jgi:hypothetical protein